MDDYVIFTDGGADIPAELCGQYGIQGVSMEYLLNGKAEAFRPDDPMREARCSDFYHALRHEASISTSQVTPFAFEEAFAPVLESGKDILYCAFSSGMSSTWQNVQTVRELLLHRFPQRAIRCVDSLSASGGQGVFVYQAALNRERGMSLEENGDWLESRARQVCHWFTVGDLNFLRRGGRISSAQAFLGGKLQIKPILVIDEEGKLRVIQKARGQKAAIQSLLGSYRAALDFGEADPVVFVGHAGAQSAGAQLAEMVRQASPQEVDVRLIPLSPIIGAHTGPDMLFICHFGSHR